MAWSKEEQADWDRGDHLRRRVVDFVARLCLVFVNAGPMVLNIVVVVQLMRANGRAFEEINYYLLNSFRLYGGDQRDGYVDMSTIPKQSGGYVWTVFFHTALIVLLLGGIAAELIVFKNFRKFSFIILGALNLSGLISGDRSDVNPKPGMYLISLAMYKLFLVSVLFSQSFQPLEQFNNSEFTPDRFSWRLFAIWTTYALLASTIPSILARCYVWISEKDAPKRDAQRKFAW